MAGASFRLRPSVSAPAGPPARGDYTAIGVKRKTPPGRQALRPDPVAAARIALDLHFD
jgi:hypothetical protein